ncbi:membrane-binding protein [Chryseobacterium lathyri]|uniref:Antitoxin component YwqK of YwqJK toxin-antitoxin module n=1 Tax=Chryseobacterium lathyri TaxID=395933 RepID=A0ABT9SNG5_9FLAO|nr:membrane-binding protein [Chryseobacterium lathyri]MDP9960998.1 antitoxin component YwqK of YwqJK toxin-antitoxin module [Chryseobacterium lathyri]
MKKLFTSAILALILSISVGAQEKIYFDENWEKTTQDKMEFYRETENKGKLILIKDFYKNGKLQMEGLASDATPGSEVYEGKVTWYTPEGKVLNTGTFSGGKQTGPSQTFDEKGRPLDDLVYKEDGTFKGKVYIYKDPENALFYNSITTYESADNFKTVIYDEDIKGIRYETTVDSNGKYETKYYGDKGKQIGINKGGSSDDNVLVEYYYNPMRVSKIEKYKSDGTVKEGIIYSKNGKILQEEKKNKKDGYKITYDETGKKIGNLIYSYDKESDYYKPQDGEDYQFNYEFTGFSAIDVYKNGSIILSKYFDDNGKLSSEKTLKDDLVQEIRYYHPDGRQKGILTYKDDIPYSGTLYEELSEQQYKDGVLVLSKSFREDEKIRYEKKLNAKQNGYDATVYDDNGSLVYTYAQPLEETEGFTAQIIQYVKGKAGNKAAVKDGILQSGKIKYKTESGLKEMERSGKWILLKVYNPEGKLIQDSKILAEVEDQNIYNVLSTTIQEDDLLYNF